MALKRGIVVLEEYNENWNKEYLEEEKLLKETLKDKIVEIHHIGSTSIKGLKAKPIIDILLVINDLNEINEIESLLIPLGYENKGPQGIEDRCFFPKGPDSARSHYVHITTPKSNTYYNQLYFKKYLINHPEYIKEYNDLKENLANLYADDRKQYTSNKHDFIQNVINLAKKEYDK